MIILNSLSVNNVIGNDNNSKNGLIVVFKIVSIKLVIKVIYIFVM